MTTPSPLSKQIVVEAMANMHSHLREDIPDQQRVVHALILYGIEGGSDIILPMPNTDAGLTTRDKVLEYHRHLDTAPCLLHRTAYFVRTMMINERTTSAEIDACVQAGIKNAKVYPLDRTTKSHNGVRDYSRLISLLNHCARVGMTVHFHPEHPWMEIKNRDAEYLFVPIIDMLMRRTEVRIVWEHGTDFRCIPFWKEWAKSGRFFVTLTAHHLATDEDETFGDVRATCKPTIKTRYDKEQLVSLVEEDNPWVMAGLDDAPHDISKKHVHSGKCACGAFTSPFGINLYAHALKNMLERGEAGVQTFINFTSKNARRAHSLPEASHKVVLVREPFKIPTVYAVGTWKVEPFGAGATLDFSIEPYSEGGTSEGGTSADVKE